MTRQYISSDKKNMLQFEHQKAATYKIFDALPEFIIRLKFDESRAKEIKLIYSFLRALNEHKYYASSRYVTEGLLQLNTDQYHVSRPIVYETPYLLSAVVKSTEGFKTGNNARGKTYYETLHNKKSIIIQTIDYLVSIIDKNTFYPFADAHKNSQPPKIVGSFVIECLQSIKKTLTLVQLPAIDFSDFKLQEFENVNKSIEDKKLYYVVYDNSFLTLTRTKHGRTMFEWNLTQNINHAFLFSGDLDSYDLYYSKESISQVFVEVQLKSITNPALSNLTEELAIKLERRDVNSIISNDLPVQRAKTNKL